MVNKLLIIFFITFSLFLIYCNDSPSKSIKKTIEDDRECLKSKDDVLFPGDIGSIWSFKMWHHGIDYGDTFSYSICDTLTINYEGKEHNCFVARWDTDLSEINWLYYNDVDGLYIAGGFSNDDTLILPVLWLKYPVEKGDTWNFPRMVFNSIEKVFYIKDTIQYSCLTSDSVFISVNDTFIVNEYRSSPQSQGEDVYAKEMTHFYFSPRIGLIGKRWTTDIEPNYTKAIVKIFDYCLY